MMILILIITQQNSPQNRHFIFTSNKPLTTIKLGRIIEEKEIIVIAIIHTPSSPTLTFSHSLLLSHPFPTTDSGNMYIYIYIYTVASRTKGQNFKT